MTSNLIARCSISIASPGAGMGGPGDAVRHQAVHVRDHVVSDWKEGSTIVSLTQDNNPTEEARSHSEKNWGMMLEGLKKYQEH